MSILDQAKRFFKAQKESYEKNVQEVAVMQPPIFKKNIGRGINESLRRIRESRDTSGIGTGEGDGIKADDSERIGEEPSGEDVGDAEAIG